MGVYRRMTELSLISAVRAEVQVLEEKYRRLDEALILNLMKRAVLQRLLIVYAVDNEPAESRASRGPVSREGPRIHSSRPSNGPPRRPATIDSMVDLVATLGPNGAPVSLKQIHSNAHANLSVVSRLLTMSVSRGKLTYADGHYQTTDAICARE
jgi:hypothetical protein